MYKALTKFLIIAQCLGFGCGSIGSPIPALATDESKPAEEKFDKPYGYHLNPILDAIKANSEQRKKITAILEEMRPMIEPLRVKFKEKQAVFLNGMATGASAEDLLCAQRELGQIRGEINDQYLLMRLRVRKLLNPTQIAPYEKYLAAQGWIKKKDP